MIFLDTSLFLRYLVQPATPNDHSWHAIATALFDAVAQGTEQITTSEAVFAEVCFVLHSKRQYGVAPADIADLLEPILRFPGFHLPSGVKQRYRRALDLWAATPQLEFVDALTVASVEKTDISLATFDSHFDALPDITRWQPPDAGTT